MRSWRFSTASAKRGEPSASRRARQARKDFQVAARGFLDISALPPMPPGAAQLGLDGLKRIELTWGFQNAGPYGPRNTAIRSVLRVVAPALRRGVLALLDQPSFLIPFVASPAPRTVGFYGPLDRFRQNL